ncbi:MAG: hypothetical protein U1D30_02725 [Planctomycetota bacterium]
MTRYEPADFDQLTAVVDEIEKQTSAEVVVSIHPQAGGYRDVDYLIGGIFALLGLAFIVFNPWTEHAAIALPIDLFLLALTGALLGTGIPGLRRLLTTQKRRIRQTRDAAMLEFHRHAVGHTRARTGVLIYLAILERQIEVIADIGILATIPGSEWSEQLARLHHVARSHDPKNVLIEEMRSLGDLLARYLPRPDEDLDELPNRPRTSA